MQSSDRHMIRFTHDLPVPPVAVPWGATRDQAAQAVAAAVAVPWGRNRRGWQVEVTARDAGQLVARGKVRHGFTITPPLVVWS